jgi:VanZ family protein
VLTIVYWCGLFGLTHLPAPQLPKIPVTDKTAHALTYGGLAMGLFVSMFLSKRRRASDVAILVLGIMLAYGAIDEWTQIPVGRSCEMADWFADAAGSSVAVVVGTILSSLFAG